MLIIKKNIKKYKNLISTGFPEFTNDILGVGIVNGGGTN
jgi:hypothetical protein